MSTVLRITKGAGIFVGILCPMDNHYHMILRQEEIITISKVMQRIMISYAMYYNKKYDLVGHLFQGRFQSRLITNELDLKKTVQYIANNPVEAGYAERPEEYKWLYIHEDFKKYLK